METVVEPAKNTARTWVSIVPPKECLAMLRAA
jgi:hypothetical protein